MKKIPLIGKLSDSHFALVDNEDFERVMKHGWYRVVMHGTESAMMSGARGRNIYMHRFIMDARKGKTVGHKNGNKLDNRRKNLCIASRSETQGNRKQTLLSVAGCRGVTFTARNKSRPYRARIMVEKKIIDLGYFPTKEAASKAYFKAAKKAFGEFARKTF